MNTSRKLPPVWLMGLTNATFGMYGGFAVVTLPAMLAAEGVPGGRAAAITSTVLSPGFWVFLLAPILDVRLSRRTYALVCSAIAALSLGVAVACRQNIALVEGLVIFGYVAAMLVQGAVGGWMGALSPHSNDSRLGAWFAVSNLGSGGIMMVVAGQCNTRLPAWAAGAIIGAMLLLPSLLYFFIPAPGPDRCLARDSFTQFFAAILSLLRRREVLIALACFALPCASFTLTNVLGGIGADFSASERMVGLLAGVGSSIAGVAGSLLLPTLARKIPLRPLYLSIGVTGALFTIGLLLLPSTPATFAVAITGENAFQALAFAAGNAITFEVIGPGNPLAATLFSLLIATTNLPIILMGFMDGHAYTRHGVTGSFLTDAAISIAACLLLGTILTIQRRAGTQLHQAH